MQGCLRSGKEPTYTTYSKTSTLCFPGSHSQAKAEAEANIGGLSSRQNILTPLSVTTFAQEHLQYTMHDPVVQVP